MQQQHRTERVIENVDQLKSSEVLTKVMLQHIFHSYIHIMCQIILGIR